MSMLQNFCSKICLRPMEGARPGPHLPTLLGRVGNCNPKANPATRDDVSFCTVLVPICCNDIVKLGAIAHCAKASVMTCISKHGQLLKLDELRSLLVVLTFDALLPRLSHVFRAVNKTIAAMLEVDELVTSLRSIASRPSTARNPAAHPQLLRLQLEVLSGQVLPWSGGLSLHLPPLHALRPHVAAFKMLEGASLKQLLAFCASF
mmetsp:Transcript_73059/g.174057  ORF Transcript_73059/g.174057 Transcript_73059/m.174057 type:complete len:205 (-) Transcript_73059:368-982(-)